MRRATTWDGLRGVLKDAQAAFDGEIIDPVEGEIQIPTNALQDTYRDRQSALRAGNRAGGRKSAAAATVLVKANVSLLITH
jgi:hypothetical protein